MSPAIQPADTEAQREAIYRFRYTIYVEEMDRYLDAVRALRKRLATG